MRSILRSAGVSSTIRPADEELPPPSEEVAAFLAAAKEEARKREAEREAKVAQLAALGFERDLALAALKAGSCGRGAALHGTTVKGVSLCTVLVVPWMLRRTSR